MVLKQVDPYCNICSKKVEKIIVDYELHHQSYRISAYCHHERTTILVSREKYIDLRMQTNMDWELSRQLTFFKEDMRGLKSFALHRARSDNSGLSSMPLVTAHIISNNHNLFGGGTHDSV